MDGELKLINFSFLPLFTKVISQIYGIEKPFKIKLFTALFEWICIVSKCKRILFKTLLIILIKN
jgi:hypothetical protein